MTPLVMLTLVMALALVMALVMTTLFMEDVGEEEADEGTSRSRALANGVSVGCDPLRSKFLEIKKLK